MTNVEYKRLQDLKWLLAWHELRGEKDEAVKVREEVREIYRGHQRKINQKVEARKNT